MFMPNWLAACCIVPGECPSLTKCPLSRFDRIVFFWGPLCNTHRAKFLCSGLKVGQLSWHTYIAVIIHHSDALQVLWHPKAKFCTYTSVSSACSRDFSITLWNHVLQVTNITASLQWGYRLVHFLASGWPQENTVKRWCMLIWYDLAANFASWGGHLHGDSLTIQVLLYATACHQFLVF